MTETPTILDVTAGNRHIWSDKSPEGVIFLDIEPNLRIPPDVVGDFRKMSMFEDESFNLVVFDPPFARCGDMHNRPDEKYGSYWGSIDSTFHFLRLVNGGLKEIYRVLRPNGFLYLKFNDVHFSLEKLLLILKSNFTELIRTSRRSQSGKGNKSATYWILFQKKSDIMTDSAVSHNTNDSDTKEESHD